jgi:hypothetical protein
LSFLPLLPRAFKINHRFNHRNPVLGRYGIGGAVLEVRVMVAIRANSTSADMPRKPAASHTGTPRCIGQVAAVWRRVWDVTPPGRPASLTALLKPFLTETTGFPLNSTKQSGSVFVWPNGACGRAIGAAPAPAVAAFWRRASIIFVRCRIFWDFLSP